MLVGNRVAVAGLLSVALLVSGCGRGDDGGSASGAAGELSSAPGFDGKTFTVGAINPTSGPVAATGGSILAGSRAYFEALNADGGVAGKYPVDVNVQDSKYDVATALQAYSSSHRDVAMYVHIFGTSITNALLERLNSDHIIGLPGSFDLAWSDEEFLLPVGPSYEVQAASAIEWASANVDTSMVCAVVQDDSMGEGVVRGFEHAVEELGLEAGPVVEISPAATDFSGEVQRVDDAGCTTVLMGAIPTPTGAVLGKAAEVNSAAHWVGVGATYSSAFADGPASDYIQQNYTLVNDGTAFGDDSAAGMADLVKAHEEYTPDAGPEYAFTFGYIQAMAAHQVLEAAVAAGDVTREGLKAAMDGIAEFDYEGLSANFGWGPAGERTPPSVVSVFKVDATTPDRLAVTDFGFRSDVAANFLSNR